MAHKRFAREVRDQIAEALAASRQFEPTKAPYTYVDARVTIDGVEFPRVGLRKKGFIGSQSSDRPIKVFESLNTNSCNVFLFNVR